MRGAAIELEDLGKVLHQLSSAEATLQVIQKVVDGVDRGQIVKLHQVRLSVLMRGTSKCDFRIVTFIQARRSVSSRNCLGDNLSAVTDADSCALAGGPGEGGLLSKITGRIAFHDAAFRVADAEFR
ncbi:hypothetical protein HKD27_14135 [Gluconobacter sp. R75690]|uniref:hypothetical protein n=1 Tax=Gluconobacter TaxID=441 RepID=UPI00188A0879|nr:MULTISPECIES: hypothetical protein [unclassified Gluconobacter]MBF0852034.1 hypothetical protein [Gluconobacter sp. R75690]MBF0880611.1 hypothetical protein [Gluconobacter sp. R75828]